jgi:hypothetical protein
MITHRRRTNGKKLPVNMDTPDEAKAIENGAMKQGAYKKKSD